MMAALSCLGAWREGGRERGSEKFGEGRSVCVCVRKANHSFQKSRTQCGYKATDQHWTMRL